MAKRAKGTRRILTAAIKNGMLDTWISSRELAHKINEGYDISKGTQGYEGGKMKRDRFMSTMQLASILAEFYRKGLVQMKRPREGVVALWRAKPEG